MKKVTRHYLNLVIVGMTTTLGAQAVGVEIYLLPEDWTFTPLGTIWDDDNEPSDVYTTEFVSVPSNNYYLQYGINYSIDPYYCNLCTPSNSGDVGRGYYKVSLTVNQYFYLDLRDVNIVSGSGAIDIFLRKSGSDFEFISQVGYNNGDDWEPITSGSTHGIGEVLVLVDNFWSDSPDHNGLVVPVPVSLRIDPGPGNHPDVNWTAPTIPSGATFTYEIERKQNNDSYNTLSTSVSSTSYIDDQVGPNFYSLTYRVRSKFTEYGFTFYSDWVTHELDSAVPGPPTGLYKSNSGGNLMVNWTAPQSTPDIRRYTIDRTPLVKSWTTSNTYLEDRDFDYSGSQSTTYAVKAEDWAGNFSSAGTLVTTGTLDK